VTFVGFKTTTLKFHRSLTCGYTIFVPVYGYILFLFSKGENVSVRSGESGAAKMLCPALDMEYLRKYPWMRLPGFALPDSGAALNDSPGIYVYFLVLYPPGGISTGKPYMPDCDV
jgi:hypothetical protein